MVRSIGVATAGISARIDSFNRAAGRIARGEGDMVADVVRTMADQHAVAANIRVIRAADEMANSILHIIA